MNNRYSYKGYYIVETDEEFKMTENRNKQSTNEADYWHFKKIGVNSFSKIEDVVAYIDKNIDWCMLDYDYPKLECLD